MKSQCQYGLIGVLASICIVIAAIIGGIVIHKSAH